MFKVQESMIFKWEELNGKNLKINVGKTDNYISVIGHDEKSDKRYVLYSGEST